MTLSAPAPRPSISRRPVSRGVSRLLAGGTRSSIPNRDAIRGARALYYLLKEEGDLDWVFLAPSVMLRPGERTGVFRTGQDEVLFDPAGESRISLEDYALAMVEELLHPRHHRERFTVGY